MHAWWPFPCAWQDQPSGSTDGSDPCVDQGHADALGMEETLLGMEENLLGMGESLLERIAVSAHPRAADGIVKTASESGRM